MLYRFFLRLAAASAIFIFVVPAQAQTDTGSSSVRLKQKLQSDPSIPQLSDFQQPVTTVDEWMAQSVQTSVVEITGVRLNATEAGLEILLETVAGLEISETYVVDNALIADIANAVLIPPSGFQQANPAEGIASVSLTNLPNNFVRVAITGLDAPPIADVRTEAQGLVLSVAVEETEDDVIEIVVTGEQEGGYRVPDTSVGTRTDTPLRDIPQSIQVVPQQVLRDQQVNRLDDALRNVPGVTQAFGPGPSIFYRIRGFEALNNNLLRNGLPDPGAGELVELSNVEQVEVLKGPASVLFGLGNPGGSINIVTKRPLSEPFYTIDATVGNYSFYRGAIDLSGPLNESRTVLYRLNTAYRNSGSFVDSYTSEHLNISPVVSVAIGEGINLTLEGDYINTKDFFRLPGVPTIGTVLPNPNGNIPRNRNLAEPSDVIEQTVTRLGYRLEHKFNDSWSLRNAFVYNYRDYYDKIHLPTNLEPDNQTLNRFYREFDFVSTAYTLTTNAIGKFSTGSIEHQLLLGVDLNRFENRVPRSTRATAAPIDIFNPVYGQPRGVLEPEISNTTITNSLGIYLQDQITLTDNLKVLLGGRFDTFDQTSEDFSSNTESSDSDSAFSPRFGIIYQPIPTISLYASYISSFTPASGLFLFGGSLDNPFAPERGRQYEVGVKADLSDRFSATLAFYDLTRTNVLTEDPDNPGFQIQTGEQNSRGIELSLVGEIFPGWNLIAGYAYTNARITQDNTFEPGNQLPNTPENSFNLWTTYEIQEGDLQGLGFGFGLFFVGDRAGDLANTYDVPSYLRTDAAIFYNRDRFRVALNFRNLFDVEYFEYAVNSTRVNYGQPFTVQGTVSWEF
ncbi:TonB-dependent siderophore receptor [Gloeocapsopsis sp. AAB1 = 1H9]|uniref:TonB-dependent siderophore receptor n=2 Tax=Gloeocapsopsis TaxID=693222 RepID=A0A6N8FXG8_9CHRO|nr:TonB-dependent siderophore receptor [Gloeocapsopsis dulcis]MUL37322.1 TonB-dependent siderophore receptor [Gloeocapsopsis dulcis AAB1 = 1H9]